MGIAGIAFFVWTIGYFAAIYIALRIGHNTPPGFGKVFLVWLIAFVALFGIHLASPKVSYVSDEAARVSFLLGDLPLDIFVLAGVSTLVALVLFRRETKRAVLLLALACLIWSGLYWLALLVDFRVEYGHWPLEVQQRIVDLQ